MRGQIRPWDGLAKSEGHSNRQIAQVLGVDPETVNRDMRAANAAAIDAVTALTVG
jgi:IS30 family transposase